ncbi:hypothetical protein M9Y10_011958 [Tritrichomonas musculus]|uniref:Uncharacterized protein n=1 Tax=Tritrichomonas musculus TaxID=1915356 RepID=A0ABR2IBB2_9EUKA
MKLKMKNPGDVVIICQKTGFKERTVYNWLAKLNQDPNFNLIAKQKKKIQIFTEEQEDEIALYILESKVSKGKCFTDADCLEVLVEFYINYHWNDNIDYEFTVSNGHLLLQKNTCLCF